MVPLRDDLTTKERPWVTYTLIALNIIIFVWDRLGSLNGSGIVFSDLAMIPTEIIAALQGKGTAANLTSLFTMLFLHASQMHLVGNMFFLYTFGGRVEEVLGPFRYAIYYIFWGIVASAVHIAFLHDSTVPTLGASGAIGGVLGAYFLLFPGNRIQFTILPFVFFTFSLVAWVVLGLWFVFQIAVPQEGVANWAHAGGFAAGMLTVLILGGRVKLLKGFQFERITEDLDDI